MAAAPDRRVLARAATPFARIKVAQGEAKLAKGILSRAVRATVLATAMSAELRLEALAALSAE
jgi:hypothetical protein